MANLQPTTISVQDIFTTESSSNDPILFLITPGTDPSLEIRENARRYVGEENYFEISMGQGQGELAIEYLKQAAVKGGWVCLQNLHLVINWIPQLEKALLELKPIESFRLWITSEAHPKFPKSLLSKSFKITVEAPPGQIYSYRSKKEFNKNL
jgi:dynein heavy chain 2